eukprot:TRINITY_DN501_c0_g2_i1.p1 TRINITY_DN501_c0_g2~~TRINITY_DN501_c0_g2_i1.p1  ORF type:complete len:63 (-),score=5.87 TRINITY_DN501_c0_g2_i1:2-190(-)
MPSETNVDIKIENVKIDVPKIRTIFTCDCSPCKKAIDKMVLEGYSVPIDRIKYDYVPPSVKK